MILEELLKNEEGEDLKYANPDEESNKIHKKEKDENIFKKIETVKQSVE